MNECVYNECMGIGKSNHVCKRIELLRPICKILLFIINFTTLERHAYVYIINYSVVPKLNFSFYKKTLTILIIFGRINYQSCRIIYDSDLRTNSVKLWQFEMHINVFFCCVVFNTFDNWVLDSTSFKFFPFFF